MPAQREAKNIDGALHSPYNKNSEYCPLGTVMGVTGGGGRNLASYQETNYLETLREQVSSGKNVMGVNSKGLADASGGS